MLRKPIMGINCLWELFRVKREYLENLDEMEAMEVHWAEK